MNVLHKPASVLIVDDVPDNLRLLAGMLKKQGYTIRPVRDGRTALMSVRSNPPDIILLDIMMPNMDGFEVCRQLKSNPETMSIPVIFISALHEIFDKVKAFRLGGADYITKPFQPEEIIARIESHLSVRRLQRQLEEQNSRLQIEITDRIHAEEKLREALEKADAANLAKSRFLANMSHEIRTPMNAIIGFTEILLSKSSDETHRKHLKTILSGGQSLLAIINDILDLSKIEAGKLELQYEPVSIRELLTELREMFSFTAKEKSLELETDIPDDIPEGLILDKVRIRQILINLIGNAIKFTHSGYVRITVQSERCNMQRDLCCALHLEVRDSGIGIPQEQIGMIFENFVQQQGQKVSQYGGTGLGLSIAKKLTEMMYGTLSVSSEVGKGSTFRIVFPNIKIAECTIADIRESETENILFAPARILIVDDVRLNRELVKDYMEGSALIFIEADSGETALDILAIEKADLILMDLRMPGKSGEEITEIIKNNRNMNHIPVIAMTASVMKEKEESIRNLFDGYLRKPLSKKELVGELKKYLAYKTDTSSDQNEAASDSSHQSLISSLPGIDGRAGLRLVGNDEKFYKKFLRMFYERAEHSESVIRDLLNRNDMQQAEIEIHTLKGMSAHIGATELHSAACQLEQAVRERDKILLGNFPGRFGNALTQVLNSIRGSGILNKAENICQLSEIRKYSDLSPEEQAEIGKHLQHLSSLIRSGNLEAEEYIETVMHSLSGLGMEEQLATLEKHIENYDFRQAHDILDEILSSLD